MTMLTQSDVGAKPLGAQSAHEARAWQRERTRVTLIADPGYGEPIGLLGATAGQCRSPRAEASQSCTRARPRFDRPHVDPTPAAHAAACCRSPSRRRRRAVEGALAATAAPGRRPPLAFDHVSSV